MQSATSLSTRHRASAHQDSKPTQHPTKDASAYQLPARALRNARRATCASATNATCPATTVTPVQSASDASTTFARRFATRTTTACPARSAMTEESAFPAALQTLTVLTRRFAFSRSANAEKDSPQRHTAARTLMSAAKSSATRQRLVKTFLERTSASAHSRQSEILTARLDAPSPRSATRTAIALRTWRASTENASIRARRKLAERTRCAKPASMRLSVTAHRVILEIRKTNRLDVSALNVSTTTNVLSTDRASWTGTSAPTLATPFHAAKDPARSSITAQSALASMATRSSTKNARTSTSASRIHVTRLRCAKTRKETSSARVLKVSLATQSVADAESPASASPTLTAPTRPFARTQNAEIHASHATLAEQTQFAEPLVIPCPADAHQQQKETRKRLARRSSAQRTTSVTHANPASTRNASIPAHCQTLVDKTRFARPRTTSASAHVNLEQLEILFLAAFNCNTAALTINVQLRRNATTESAQRFARHRATA